MKFSLLILVALLSGCSMLPKSKVVSPAVTVSETGKVEVKGDSQVAPKVDTKKTDTRMVIPEGSTFVFNEKLGTMTLTMAKASEIALNRTETAIEGPVAFTPPPPPTLEQVSESRMTLIYRIGLGAGIALGLFGLVRAWDLVMYGGAAISVACATGLFIQKHPLLLLLIGVGCALAIAGPVLWHTKVKYLEPQPQPKVELQT